MRKVDEKCLKVMEWFAINRNKSKMPEEVFASICGNQSIEVWEELKSNGFGYYSNKITVWSITKEQVDEAIRHYKRKIH